MEFYGVLSLLSAVIVALGLLVWRKTKSVSFPLGIAFMYYWSLYGAWSIIKDRLGGDSGKHYAYLEKKLFPIYLDDTYLTSLLLYALFIIVVEITLLVVVRSTRRHDIEAQLPVSISHSTVLIIGGVAGITSYLIVRSSLQLAEAMNVSAYHVTRGVLEQVSPYFTIHQVLNRVALIPTALGLATLWSGRKPRLLAGLGSRWTALAYLTLLGGLFAFAFVLGNKNEVFLAGVAGSLFYLANARRLRIVPLVAVSATALIGLWLVDLFRGVPLTALGDALSNLSGDDLSRVLEFVLSSNEAFGAHFSMYGVLVNDVPPTYGSSILSLAASVVPRLLWPGRPEDIYAYYADRVRATPGQGYAIHHATGWYLNFGTPGVILGAMVFGVIWAACFNIYADIRGTRPRWYFVFQTLAPWMFVAYIPALIRAGFEIYKGLVIEAFLIPTIVLALATKRWTKAWHSRAKASQSG